MEHDCIGVCLLMLVAAWCTDLFSERVLSFRYRRECVQVELKFLQEFIFFLHSDCISVLPVCGSLLNGQIELRSRFSELAAVGHEQGASPHKTLLQLLAG